LGAFNHLCSVDLLERAPTSPTKRLGYSLFAKDVAATIYRKLGIPPDQMTETPDGRPVRLNEVRPIKEWT